MGRSRRPPEEIAETRRRAALIRHHGTEKGSKAAAGPQSVASRSKPPKHLETIADYDRLLGLPITWDDAKKRESVQGEIIDNERRRDERAVQRKQLYTAKQVNDQREREDDAIFAELADLPGAMSEFVPPELKHAAHKVAQQWIADFRKRVADKFAEMRA